MPVVGNSWRSHPKLHTLIVSFSILCSLSLTLWTSYSYYFTSSVFKVAIENYDNIKNTESSEDSSGVVSSNRHSIALTGTGVIFFPSEGGKHDSVSTDVSPLQQNEELSDLSDDKKNSEISTTQKVLVLNTVLFHYEVLYWLVSNLGAIKEVNLTIVIADHKYGSKEFMNRILPSGPEARILETWRLRFDHNNMTDADVPDVVFLCTCLGGDFNNLTAILPLWKRLKPSLKLVCVVHHPDRILEHQEQLHPYVGGRLTTLLTLAPHVCKYVRTDIFPLLTNISSVFNALQFISLPATFLLPQTNSCPTKDSVSSTYLKDQKAVACFTSVVIQGKFDGKRRNYSNVFHDINAKLISTEGNDSWSEFQLNLLGAFVGKEMEPIPSPLINRVVPWEGLVYDEFYDFMHHHVALLPAFASDEYYTLKSSSSVAASLIAGVPLLASRKFLEAYNFFGSDSVYFQAEGETEADVIDRILRLPLSALVEKRRMLSNLNQRLVDTNILHFKRLLRSEVGTCS